MIHPLKAHDFTYRGPPLRKKPFSRKIIAIFSRWQGTPSPQKRANVSLTNGQWLAAD